MKFIKTLCIAIAFLAIAPGEILAQDALARQLAYAAGSKAGAERSGQALPPSAWVARHSTVYAYPGETNQALGEVKRGSYVRVIQCLPNFTWCEVMPLTASPGQVWRGWVVGRHLRLIKQPPVGLPRRS